MKAKNDIKHREAGSFLTKVIFIFALVGVGMSMVSQIGPGFYDYLLLRDLADLVVSSYSKMPIDEVRRRVDHEMNRSRLSGDDFRLTKTPTGYRVEVDYRIPLVLKIGDQEFSVPGHEEWVLTYKAGS
ncbi:MAG: hypothetical protein H7839_12770 [Magnetococcus sp. YQC-5]